MASVTAEAAHDATVAGQAPSLSAEGYGNAARQLQARARDLAVLAEAALIAASTSHNHRQIRRKPRR